MFCSRDTAIALAARTDFLWHQRFNLGAHIVTPGVNDIEWLLDTIGLPADLSGKSVLDIGTTNGGGAFSAERRGAQAVTAVDVYDDKVYGFKFIREALASNVTFSQGTIYTLPDQLRERFDIVLFLGVIYHLRHPLLALDNVRRLTKGTAWIESAVADGLVEGGKDQPQTYFLRTTGEAAGVGHFDRTNWFIPTTRCLVDWCQSSGLEPVRVHSWGSGWQARAMVEAKPVRPEYLVKSYERPIKAMLVPED